jgi:hypothetical protein
MHLLAYIDPGTGSFFLQLLVGGVFGILFVIRRSWRQLKGLLGSARRNGL